MTNYLDLFSGIGGFAYGAYLAGVKFDKHFFSEIEPYAVELYGKRFPDAIGLGSITDIDFEKLKKENPGEWVITGGFPCQDISIAGKGVGINGARSGLWFEYARAIRILRPKYIIAENVSAITFRGLDRVLSGLAEIGYDVEWQDIRASDMGAPHRRERIWIIAYPGLQRPPEHEKQTAGIEQCDKAVAYTDSQRHFLGQPEKLSTKRWEHAQRDTTASGQDVAYPGCELREQGNAGGMEADTPKRSDGKLHNKSGGQGHLPDADKDRSQGERTEQDGEGQTGLCGGEAWREKTCWTVEPPICELVNGLPSGMDRYEGRLTMQNNKRADQLKGLGNAIVPQIAAMLFTLCENGIAQESNVLL